MAHSKTRRWKTPPCNIWTQQPRHNMCLDGWVGQLSGYSVSRSPQSVPPCSYSPSEGNEECANLGMFNSAASQRALSPYRFIVLAEEEWGAGWDLTTLGFLIGDLACTLLNHLNPELFCEQTRVNEKLIAFSDHRPICICDFTVSISVRGHL